MTLHLFEPITSPFTDPKRRPAALWAILFVLLGAVAAHVASEMGWGIVEHVAHGVIVAALVGLFWHFPEVSDLLRRFARELFIDRGFLRQLDRNTLLALRRGAADALVSPYVTTQVHDWTDLHAEVEELLFSSILPGPPRASDAANATRGVYRQNYDENVTVRLVRLEQLLKELDLSMDGLDARVLNTLIADLKTVTTSELVSPVYGPTLVRFYTRAQDIPGIPPDKRVRVALGTNGARPTALPLTVTDHPDSGVEIRGERTVPLLAGVTKVRLETHEYDLSGEHSFIANTMDRPTKGLRVEVNLHSDLEFTLDGDVMGLAKEEPSTLPNGIRLVCKGWLLEEHGYIVFWWRKA